MCRSGFESSSHLDRVWPSFRAGIVGVVTVRIEFSVILVPFDVLDRLTRIDLAVLAADYWFARVRQPR